ncbi:E3 ubiquitin-protein ligase DTX3L-like [Lissotriton helveticus]
MAAARGADDESTPMDMDTDQSTPQPACGKLHRLVVRGLPATDSPNRKLEKTIGSLCNVLQLGEVDVISKGVKPGCLQLKFTCSRADTCVKNITLEIDGTRYEPAFNRENDLQGARADDPIQKTQDSQVQELQDVPMSASQGSQEPARATEYAAQSQLSHSWPSAAASTVQDWQIQGWSGVSGIQSPDHKAKFHMVTGVQLDLKALPSNLHEAVSELIRLNDLRRSFPIDGKITIEGPFEAVECFYRGVIALQNSVPGELTPSEIQQRTLSENEPMTGTHYREQDSTKEQDTNILRLPLFHYEYLNKVCADKISAIQQRHQVDILPEVVLKLQDKGGQGYAQVEKALDALTNAIQPLITDLGQTKFSISESERQYVVNAFRQIQKNKPLYTLMELEEEVAITGPKSNLKQVKDELLELVKSKTMPKAVLKIENKMTTMVKEMDVPKLHWEILENLFRKELDTINSIYQVLIEPEILSHKGSVRILMKNQCATQDLSGNALQAFVSLYQKAMTSCIVRAVDGRRRDRVRVLYDEIRFSHQGVRCIVPEGGGLALIGLPQHVEVAVRDIEERLGEKIFPHLPSGSVGASGLLSSSVSAQPKKEAANGLNDEKENCCICMDNFEEKITTPCNHSFCKMCWDRAMASKPECPICKKTYGKIEGNQPEGTMTHRPLKDQLPGFGYCGTIEIQYHFPSGIQSHKHPYPGKPYTGATRSAYLPDNTEGQDILRMLQQAFNQKLIFTIGESRTTGVENTVTWNDIHHKTNIYGGPTGFGYPDPNYLKRVKEELRAKGIE